MTFPDVHLAGEAVAAFVDGELGSVAHARALAHLDICAECRGSVRAQQEAVDLLAAEPPPTPPAALMARLREIPMTAELGGGDIVLAVDGEELVWGRSEDVPGENASGEKRSGEKGSAAPKVAATQLDRPERRDRPAGAPGGSRRPQQGRPGSYPPQREVDSARRMRRVLVGAMAGFAFGVFAITAPTSAAGNGAPDTDLIRGVNNGGVVDPPVSGDIAGVQGVRSQHGQHGQDNRDGQPGGYQPGRLDPVPLDPTPFGTGSGVGPFDQSPFQSGQFQPGQPAPFQPGSFGSVPTGMGATQVGMFPTNGAVVTGANYAPMSAFMVGDLRTHGGLGALGTR